MGTKHQNMLQLIERLKVRSMTQQEIASHFGVDARTVMRYIKELQSTQPNLKIQALDGRKKSYSIQEEDDFSPREIEDLKKVIQDLGDGGNHKHARLIQSILNKIEPQPDLEATLPSLQTVDKNFYINHGPLAEHDSDNTRAQKLLYFIQEQMVVKITYQQRQDEEFQRSEPFYFEPYKLALRVGKLYLIGFKEGEDQARQIPISKIVRYNASGRHFTPRDFDVDEFYRYSFGQWVEEIQPQEVVLELNETWIYNLFRASNFYPAVKFSKKGNKNYAHLTIKVTRDFKNWLFGMMPGIQIKKPLALKKELLLKAESILK